MNLPRQLLAVTRMNLAAISTRFGGALVIVLGMAAVVGVMVTVLSLSKGLLGSVDSYARADYVMVRSANSAFEGQSQIPREAALKIIDLPGLKKGGDGATIASAEVVFFITGVYKENSLETGLPLRGATPRLFQLRPQIKIMEGRMFTPGLREFIVGGEAQKLLNGMSVGDQVMMRDGPWTIVGSYDSGGFADWGMFTDADTLVTALGRNTFSSVIAALDSPATFETFKAAVAGDPTLRVTVERESEYWLRFYGPANFIYRLIGYGLGGIMGIGALFAALNTMYAAISARTAEIATLRAIGFAPMAIVVSIFAEALVLAAMGAAIGVTIAWFAFNGRHYDAGHFDIAIDGSLATIGAAAALGLGGLAALFPALRAARLPVATALQVR